MKQDNLPGHLAVVPSAAKWLDYLFKSDLSPQHKLCGVVISRVSSYSIPQQLFLSLISNYSISRIVKMNSIEVQTLIDDLIKLGWLFDTGGSVGARKIYALTFSLIPLGDIKQ